MFEKKKKEERKDANVEVEAPVGVNSKVGDIENADEPREDTKATDTQLPQDEHLNPDPKPVEEKKEEPKEKPWVGNHIAGQ